MICFLHSKPTHLFQIINEMFKKLLTLFFLCLFFVPCITAQHIVLSAPDNVSTFADLLKVSIQSDSVNDETCYLEVWVFKNGLFKAKGTSSNFELSGYNADELSYVEQDALKEKTAFDLSSKEVPPRGVYTVNYRLIAVEAGREIASLRFTFSIPSIDSSDHAINYVKGNFSIRDRLKQTSPLKDNSFSGRKVNLANITKGIKTTGVVSSTYNYGLQQFNPNAVKPQGYFIYNGTGTLSYKIVPVKFSFQYTDFKEYYGIPKYFRVSLDAQQLRQNILGKAAEEQKKVKDSLNASKNMQQNAERRIAFLKSKLDTSKIIDNNRLLEEARRKGDTLLNEQRQNEEEYLRLLKDSAIQRTYENDSLYRDSLDDLRARASIIESNRRKVDEQRKRYERMKNYYDSTGQELKKHEEDYRRYKAKADTLQKLSSQFGDPDSMVKAYILARMPHPENSAGKAVLGGLTAFVVGIKKFEVGMCNPNYSLFLVNGTPLKGINIEWQNNKFFAAVAYGKTIVNPLANLQRNQYNPILAVRNVYNYFDFNNDTLTRKVLAVKFGIGKQEGNHIYFGLLNGTGSAAIANDTSIHHKKERNGVNEIGGRLILTKSNILSFSYAKSSVLKLQDLSDASLIETLEQVYKQQYNESAMLQLNSSIARTGTVITSAIRLILPYYESFGLSFINADNIRYEIQVKQAITNRIKITLNYRYFQDNMLWLYNQRNIIQTAGVSLQYKVNKYLTSSFLVSPATINKKSGSKSAEYFNPFRNNSMIATGLVKYAKKKTQLDLTDNFYKFYFDTAKTIFNQASIAYNYTINKTTQWNNEVLHFYSSKKDTSSNSCLILQSGVKTTLKKLAVQATLRGSYSNVNGVGYGYDIRVQYPATKHFVIDLTTSKYVGGNFLLGFNDSVLRKYPYQTILKLSYKW
jgi:hypothetical protein